MKWYSYSRLAVLIEYEYRQRLSTITKNQGFSLAIESKVLAISEKCRKIPEFRFFKPICI